MYVPSLQYIIKQNWQYHIWNQKHYIVDKLIDTSWCSFKIWYAASCIQYHNVVQSMYYNSDDRMIELGWA